MGERTVSIAEEGQRILQAAHERDIALRLIGGLAVKSHCPSASQAPFARNYPDLDLVGLTKQSREIRRLFPELGYSEDKMFNALNRLRGVGPSAWGRLTYYDLDNKRHVDIFLNRFIMNHNLDLRARLTIDELTIPLADLLLTKLQIVNIERKDVLDVLAIFKDHSLEATDAPDAINAHYIVRICSKDWGWWKTVTTNLQKILGWLDDHGLSEDEKEGIEKKIHDMISKINSEPKSLTWNMRAAIGEKKTWYEYVDTPELRF